jgi:hypothetical protein
MDASPMQLAAQQLLTRGSSRERIQERSPCETSYRGASRAGPITSVGAIGPSKKARANKFLPIIGFGGRVPAERAFSWPPSAVFA